MSGPESLTSPERNPQRVFSREEVLSLLPDAEGRERAVTRELHDEQGPYLIEVTEYTKKVGETIQYTFTRKGRHLNHIGATKSRIDIDYYQEGLPIDGEPLAVFNEAKNVWEKVR